VARSASGIKLSAGQCKFLSGTSVALATAQMQRGVPLYRSSLRLATRPGLEDARRAQFPAIFERPTNVPPKSLFNMCIRLTTGARPHYTNTYTVTTLEDGEILLQIQLLRDDGWIMYSVSLFTAPILFVKEADGALMLCMDYHVLNSMTSKDRYTLPHMDDLLNQVQTSSLFTKLYLKFRYHQMRLRPAD
jgi:hypothetical protein